MRRPKKRRRDRHGHLIVQTDPKAIGSEAFRSLRTNLQFSSVDQQLKTILFTSPGPGTASQLSFRTLLWLGPSRVSGWS